LARQRDGDASLCRGAWHSLIQKAFGISSLSHTHTTKHTTNLHGPGAKLRKYPRHTPLGCISLVGFSGFSGQGSASVLIFFWLLFWFLGYHTLITASSVTSFPCTTPHHGRILGRTSELHLQHGKVEIQAAVFFFFFFFLVLRFFGKRQMQQCTQSPFGRDRGQRHPLFCFCFSCFFLSPPFSWSESLWEREKRLWRLI